MRKYFALIFIGLIGVFMVFASGSGNKVPDIKKVAAGSVQVDLNFGKFPLYFLTNKGQVHKKAKFYAKASRYYLWLTQEGLVFDSDSVKKTHPAPSGHPSREQHTPSALRGHPSQEGNNRGSPHSPYSTHSPKLERDVSRLIFLDANKNPEMVPIDKTKLKVNYFIGSDKSKWNCDIPTSAAVLYKELYKNIDLKVYGIEKQIEYDWIIKPGANPKDIRFEYKNVKGTRLDEKGNLLIETDFGELMHKKPVGYQRRKAQSAGRIAQHACPEKQKDVNVTFKKIAENIYGFEVGEYDKNRELIIDPVVLAYSTYLGGWRDDLSQAIAVDGSGNAYVTGYTESTDFPTLNQYQADQLGSDAFVTKLDPTQSGADSLLYSTYLGGGSDDWGNGIAVDDSGNAYVTGFTSSTDFPTLNQYQGNQGGHDVFITKLDPTQSGVSSLLYSTYLGGGSYDIGWGIAVDRIGNAYVTGETLSTDFPTLNQYQGDQGERDVFVTKLDPTQSGADSLLYSTYLGGGDFEISEGIAVDGSGYAYVTGRTNSTDFPTLNQYQGNQGGHDVFVTKLDPTQSGVSSLLYSTYLGGGSYDWGNGIAVDGSGNVYVTGRTDSTDFPTLNQYQEDQEDGASDVFITRLDPTQSGTDSLLYSTYLGGGSYDYGYAIAVDGSGNAYVTGRTHSTDFPTLNQYQIDQGDGASDVFVTRLDPTQSGADSLIYSTYLGGGSYDSGRAIAVDGNGNAYVTGYTNSWDFPTLNQYQGDQGSHDVLVTKLIYPYPPTVITTVVSSVTATSASSGGDVKYDGGAEVTARGVCWGTSQNPTTDDDHTTDGTGTGVFTSSLTNLTPNTLYYVRAYATNSVGTAYGNEETFETNDPSITVTSPNGGEDWEVGSSHNITWTSDGVESNVKIEYSINNGQNWTEIIASTENDGSFPWTVLNVDSNQCLICVSETDGDPSDTSDNVFTIFPPGITVTSPNGGESWEVDSSQNITWTSDGVESNVKIEYSTNNGDNWTEIIASTENDGSFPWAIPNVDSNQCLIGVSETNGNPADTSDNVFTIFPPGITVTSPNGGESWEINSSQNITWISTGTVGNVKIEYSTNNGGNWTEITASTANDGTHPWTVPDAVSNQCLIRVSETDGNPADTSEAVFTIFPPSLTVTSPNGGENWNVGSSQTITWTSQGTIGNVMIEYSTINGGSWKTIVQSTENDGSYNWTVPNRPSDNCLVRVSEKDEDGSPSDVSDAVFSIVSPVPGSITLRSPNGGETWVAGSSREIKWNSIGDINNVTIKYSTDSGTTWKKVVKTTTNDGSYNWVVPGTVSDRCLVRVTANDSDLDPKPADVSDAVFSILLPPSPIIRVTSPNGGEQLPVGSRFTITWYTANTREDVQIEYSINGGETWAEIIGPTENDGEYDWTVPDEPSGNCLVRIGGTDGGPLDISDEVFSIVSQSPGDITIISPNGGESWTAGSSQEIKWTGTGSIDNVTINYSKDNGTTWKTIAQTTGNDGSLDWTVPDTVSDECLVRITANDGNVDPKPSDVSDSVFSIGLPLPTLKVIAPNGGEQLTVGTRFGITWYATNSREEVKIEYSTNGGDTWTVIAEAAENDGDYDWTVPDEPSETCLVRISENSSQLVDVSDAVFSIVQPLPGDITVTAPNGGEIRTVGSSYEITWTANGEINHVTIEYSTDNGTTWKEIAQTTANDGSFDWTIADTVSEECLVRITANDGDPDPKPSDVSDEVFSIVSSTGTFRVTSPNGGESWEVGTTQPITWNNSGDINSVMLEYSYDNGNTWDTIVSSVSNSGTYDWQVPGTVSDECLVRITANDGDVDPQPTDVSDAEFSILPPQTPTIRVITPNGGEQLVIGSIYEITWFSTDSREEAKIEYSINGGETWTEIIGSTENDGDYDWTVPDEPSESCLIRISETDGQPLDISDAVFSIVQPLPGNLTVLTPNGGENLEAGSGYNISWTCSGLNSVIIEYSVTNGGPWLYIEKVPADDGSYTWMVPGTPSDNCLVRVSGADSDENPSDISDGVFTISDPSQAFIEVFTPNGGENLSVGTEYYITWTSAGINNVLIEYSTDNGAEWIPRPGAGALHFDFLMGKTKKVVHPASFEVAARTKRTKKI